MAHVKIRFICEIESEDLDEETMSRIEAQAQQLAELLEARLDEHLRKHFPQVKISLGSEDWQR